MAGSALIPFPHYLWFGYWLAVSPPSVFTRYVDRYVTHRLLVTTAGDARLTFTAGEGSVSFQSTAGDIGFYPCDHATHELAITATGSYLAYGLLLPEDQLRDLSASDGLRAGGGGHAIPVFHDTLMHASLLRLARGPGSGLGHISEEIGDEIAARQIVIRLCVLLGAKAPDWLKDTSVFAPAVMRQIIDRLDATLGTHQSLAVVSGAFGLSPSHFARKFKKSAGVSLDRFVIRRRISRALARLREDRVPLTQLALELGFCSQSHFTRSFSRLTGFTPHQFRRGPHDKEK